MFHRIRLTVAGLLLAFGLVLTGGAATAQTVTTYATNTGGPAANVTFDSSGALFVSGFNSNDFYRVPPGGGAGAFFASKSGAFGGIVGPDDGLYYATTIGTVERYAPGATTPDAAPYATSLPVGSYLNLAFDTSGRLYVVSRDDDSVYRVPAGGGAATVFGTVPAGSRPFGLAINSAGRLYISFEGITGVYIIEPAGGAATLFATTPAADSYGLTVSPTGEVYVSSYSGDIYAAPAAGGAATTFVSTIPNPTALTISGGILYAGNYGIGDVFAISLPGPPPPPVATIPTLSEWAMILFAGLLAMGAVWTVRRRHGAV